MGYVLALISSASFGLIPLFSLPLLHAGMSAESVLFYRFLFGALVLGGIVLARRDATVVDADAISRRVTGAGGAVLGRIRSVFGDGVITADGALDRFFRA